MMIIIVKFRGSFFVWRELILFLLCIYLKIFKLLMIEIYRFLMNDNVFMIVKLKKIKNELDFYLK